MSDLTAYFEEDSPLRKALPGFQPRAGQAWMAEAVAEAIENEERLVVEAGTGTGKTFAYLIPALLSGRRAIISTGTKALQDQLYHRDLPLVSGAVGRPVSTALLKGRANYLCLERLDTASTGDVRASRHLETVRAWRHRTSAGDKAELTEVPEDSPVWPLVTSTSDNCLGQKCPSYKECHVVRARRAAQEADLVVVNHHLLLADLALKEEGFVEFLPGADVVVVDEAHQIPDLATQFFGQSVGSRELERLLDELRAATLPTGQVDVQRRLDRMHYAVRQLRAVAPRTEGRHELAPLAADLDGTLAELRNAMAEVCQAVEALIDASVDIEKLYEQLLVIGSRLANITGEDVWDGLRWIDVRPRSIRLHLTPLDVASNLSAVFHAGHQAWVFTSATLAVGDDFGHFTQRMGLKDARGVTFPSPYQLAERGLVLLPPGLPSPADPTHTQAMLDAVLPLLDATSGGMFCLFTSHRALNAAKTSLRRAKAALRGRPLLVQGDSPRDDLVRRFRDLGDAVLLGTGTFWEGIDVRGRALTVVAIDKLPFASPADPLMMARLEFIRRQGGNGFTGHQLPVAALALKQGAGRLLRDATDYGVVVVCDPRIRGKSYGRLFLDCLQPMPVTDVPADAAAFLRRFEAGDTARRERTA
ncbi:MAG: ATP-dependent DNA helicase [Pseudomonadota bacterium]